MNEMVKTVSKALAVVACAMLFVTGCSGTKKEEKASGSFKAGMVTDTGGLHDESFNQRTWDGMKRMEKELGANIKALESKRDEDYVPNLIRFAREKRDLTFAVGFKLEKAILDVSSKFKDVKFGIIDTDLGGKAPKNVVAITFKDEEGAFLVGVLAGSTTKTNKVGFIGGISSPVIERFETGFIAGVKAVNPKAKVNVVYAESFTDATKGRSLANSMYNSGVDVIFHASGGVGKGLFDEVKTRQKGKYWAIGVDRDQSALAPNHTLSSVIKRVDVAVFNIAEKLKEGHFDGGKSVNLGLKEDAIGIADNTSKMASADAMRKVQEYKEKIMKGEIKVPRNRQELKG